MPEPKKLRLAWYSFACCEDSTIMFAEFLNDYFFEFKKHFDFVDASVFSSKRDLSGPLDITVIEGAANSPEHEATMKNLRERSQKIVAIGSCACTGMPSAHRNTFSTEQTAEISFLLEKFPYSDKVLKVADVIPVDAQVPGCPMNLDTFLAVLNQLLKEFGHQPLLLSNQ